MADPTGGRSPLSISSLKRLGCRYSAAEKITDARGVISVYTQRWPQDKWRQVNVVHASPGTLRGLHWQLDQDKLIVVTAGEIFDAVVDVRSRSSTFGEWAGVQLREGEALYVPAGLAHGFAVPRGTAVVCYLMSTEYVEGLQARMHPFAQYRNGPIVWPPGDWKLSAADEQAGGLQ